MSNRWLIINHLLRNIDSSESRPNGVFRIVKLSSSGDTRLLRRLLTQLEQQTSDVFYCNNAGSVARFLMPLLALTPGSHVLTGDKRLQQRPMAPLINALRQMGLRIECSEQEGFLPVTILGGTPTKRTVQVDPLLSSQFVSALLLIAPTLPYGLSLTMTGRPTSRPYIDMTCNALRLAGANIRQSSNGRTYYVQHLDDHPKPTTINIERDWTSASYFYTVVLLRPELRIRLLGLQFDTSQGDSATDAFFQQLGIVSTEVRSPYRAAARSITIQNSGQRSKTVQFNCIDCPDLVPTFAVAGAAVGVRTVLKGVSNIALKESDRMQAIATELSTMGALIETTKSELIILPSKLHMPKSNIIHTYGDHRIAMAFAPLKVLFPNLMIENPEVVEKSYPEFWSEFNKCIATGTN